MMDLTLVAKAAFAGILLLAAWSDARRFLIPNMYPLLLVGLSALALATGFPFIGPAWSHLAHFAIALVVGMALFHFRWFGGGDVKLYAAVALWFPLGAGWFLLMATGLGGAVIVILSMAVRLLRLAFGSGERRSRFFDRRIAYGVAIAAGGIASLLWFYP